MKKIMLIYPPGYNYLRGEDRCQGNITASTASSMRACNDLGYAAAILKKKDYSIFLRDYQAERYTEEILFNDINKFNPDMIVVSTTNATIIKDIELISKIKKERNKIIVVLKGAIFYDTDISILKKINLQNINFLLGGEIESSIGQIADYSLRNIGKVQEIPNIFYILPNGEINKTNFGYLDDDLDSIPFPAREYMENNLYIRPDTGEAMATIQVSRGCPGKCIYCLTPIISGEKVRFRSPKNILQELQECYKKFKIRNFF